MLLKFNISIFEYWISWNSYFKIFNNKIEYEIQKNDNRKIIIIK